MVLLQALRPHPPGTAVRCSAIYLFCAVCFSRTTLTASCLPPSLSSLEAWGYRYSLVGVCRDGSQQNVSQSAPPDAGAGTSGGRSSGAGGGAGTAAAVANSPELGVQGGGARAGGVEVGRVSRREGEEEFEVGCVLRCV